MPKEKKERKPFSCWGCSACCRLCHLVPELNHLDSGNGVCINLQPDNSCGIYETRPEICNTKRMYEKKFTHYSWDEYLAKNEEACKILEKEMNESKDKKTK